MVTARFDQAVRSAALVLGLLVAVLALQGGPGPASGPADAHHVSASAALTAPGGAAVRLAEHLGNGLRQAEQQPLPVVLPSTALLLLTGLLLLASVPPGRAVPSARGQWSTPPRAPPMAP